MSLLFKTLCLVASLISFNQAHAEALYFYHNDHLGTPQLLTDSEQNVVWQADYDAFGQAKITLEHVEQNLRFPGQYHDAETGLHYNYYRDYDPKTGRYLQSDPIGLAGGINTYAYVGGNPLGYSDPTGLAAETLLDVAALALSAHDFQQCPSFANGLWLLADVISTAIPGLPAIGIARHVDRFGGVPRETADKLLQAERIDSGLKDDAAHRAASFLSKEQLQAGKTFPLRGGDGVERTLLQTEGGLNGNKGIYEYILDSSGKVTHQRFIKDGVINGIPNQRVPKVP